MMTIINMGKVIQFPLNRPADMVKKELDSVADEISLCMQDIDELNSHVLELMVGYEQLLNRLCELEGISLDEVMRKLKDDSER